MTNDRKIMLFIAQALDELLNGEDGPKEIGFIVIAFKEDKLSYISNAEPDAISEALKEAIKRTENQDPEIVHNMRGETLQ